MQEEQKKTETESEKKKCPFGFDHEHGEEYDHYTAVLTNNGVLMSKHLSELLRDRRPTAESLREEIVNGYLQQVVQLLKEKPKTRTVQITIQKEDADLKEKVCDKLTKDGFSCDIDASGEDCFLLTVKW